MVALPRYLIWLLVLLALAQIIWYYPRLAETMASHFDGAGRPNGWSGKGFFFGLYLVIVAFLASLFLGLGRLIGRRPEIRLPHREYWLAPERREHTIAFLNRSLLWMGAVSLALAVVVTQLAILANFEHPPRMSAQIYWVLLAYFIYLAAWLVRLFARFRKPRGEVPSRQ